MKFAASLLLLLALLPLSACTTLSNRRDLYQPTKGSGYWTNKRHEYRKREGIFGISNRHHHTYEGRSTQPEGIFGISHQKQ